MMVPFLGLRRRWRRRLLRWACVSMPVRNANAFIFMFLIIIVFQRQTSYDCIGLFATARWYVFLFVCYYFIIYIILNEFSALFLKQKTATNGGSSTSSLIQSSSAIPDLAVNMQMNMFCFCFSKLIIIYI